jgi:hypothetical protein
MVVHGAHVVHNVVDDSQAVVIVYLPQVRGCGHVLEDSPCHQRPYAGGLIVITQRHLSLVLLCEVHRQFLLPHVVELHHQLDSPQSYAIGGFRAADQCRQLLHAREAYEVDAKKRTETAREGQFRVMTWLVRVSREIDIVVMRQDWSVAHHSLGTLAEIRSELNTMYIPLTDASKASWRRALEAIAAYEKALRNAVSIGVQMEYRPVREGGGFFANRLRNKFAKRGAKVAEEVRKAADILEDSSLFLGYSRDELLSDVGPTSDAAPAPPQIAAATLETHEPPTPEPARSTAGTGLPTESLREQTDTEPQPRGGRPCPIHGRRCQRFSAHSARGSTASATLVSRELSLVVGAAARHTALRTILTPRGTKLFPEGKNVVVLLDSQWLLPPRQ